MQNNRLAHRLETTAGKNLFIFCFWCRLQVGACRNNEFLETVKCISGKLRIGTGLVSGTVSFACEGAM